MRNSAAAALAERILSANNAEQKEYDRRNQQKVHKPPYLVSADDAQDPQHKQNNSYSLKHGKA